MYIQRHFNFSSVENYMSDEHHPYYIDSQQYTILPEETELTQNSSNITAVEQERIVFQLEDSDRETVLLESTKLDRHHPHYFVSQQNTIFQEDTTLIQLDILPTA